MPRIDFPARERQTYDKLEVYCQGPVRHMAGQGAIQIQSAVGFLLSFLRLRFASSLFVIRETFRRRLLRVEAALSRLGLEEGVEPEDVDLTAPHRGLKVHRYLVEHDRLMPPDAED
jgi:hypothetical protein